MLPHLLFHPRINRLPMTPNFLANAATLAPFAVLMWSSPICPRTGGASCRHLCTCRPLGDGAPSRLALQI